MNLDWGLILGAVLTFFVLTYLIGDNFLFRLAVYVLVGASAAYAAVVVIFDVLIPRIQQGASDPAMLVVTIVALILGALLLFKASPRLAWLGNLSVGYLVGVGAATVLGGAIIGTLGPQIVATGAPATSPSGGAANDLLNFIVVLGTSERFAETQNLLQWFEKNFSLTS